MPDLQSALTGSPSQPLNVLTIMLSAPMKHGRDLNGLLAQDAIAAWAADGRSLFVSGPTTTWGRDIARLDLATGRRERLLTFGPFDQAAVGVVGTPLVSADGRTHAYRSSQLLSDLSWATGSADRPDLPDPPDLPTLNRRTSRRQDT